MLKDIKNIQIYNKQSYFCEQYFQSSESKNEKSMNFGYLNGFVIGLKLFFLFAVFGVLISYSANLVREGDWDLENMLIACFTYIFFYSGLLIVCALMPDVSAALASAERVFRIIDESKSASIGANQSIKGLLEFKNVYFSYPDSKNYSIVNLSFFLNSKSVIRIFGNKPLPDLILRHYKVNAGQILLDNKNINEFNIHCIRDAIAYAAKDPVIFEGGLKNNLDLAHKHDYSDIEEIIERFGFSDKNSWNSEEKKKISVARCVLRKPKILIADEECQVWEGDWSLIILAQEGERVDMFDQTLMIDTGFYQNPIKNS